MLKIIIGLVAGLLFGTGLTVSQMIDPAKVIGFLDIAGSWDPSLAFVMGGAVIVTFLGYRLVFERDAPLAAPRFELPTRSDIDARLVGGAALFGLGWGLGGYCPGPALAATTIGGTSTFVFLAAMTIGMLAANTLSGSSLTPRRGTSGGALLPR